jgi:hypothetical protein
VFGSASEVTHTSSAKSARSGIGDGAELQNTRKLPVFVAIGVAECHGFEPSSFGTSCALRAIGTGLGGASPNAGLTKSRDPNANTNLPSGVMYCIR